MPNTKPRGTQVPRGTTSKAAPLSGLSRARTRQPNTDEYNNIKQERIDRRRLRSAVPQGWIHPPCTGCDGDVPRRDAERPSEWVERQTCSTVCGKRRSRTNQVLASQIRWAEAFAAHQPCVICGGAIGEKSTPREAMIKFLERATCCPRCSKAHHARSSGGIKGPHEVQSAFRKGELVSVDYAGGFGRQVVHPRPDPRPLPSIPAVGSYMSASIGWLL